MRVHRSVLGTLGDMSVGLCMSGGTDNHGDQGSYTVSRVRGD